jgi:UDP-glucose:(heptosyl)LPS alpha-1,3-glucosyltransferase
MNIAFCYESVLPARGGCETYIGDLSRRLAKEGHEVHLYSCRWDASALPQGMIFHKLEVPRGPRFLRPWRFAQACEQALAGQQHDVSMGFDKTWGQDILYPQGGLHLASREHNLRKFSHPLVRQLAGFGKALDPASRSFAMLERKQYLGTDQPIILVNSKMVQGHFQRFYQLGPERVRVLYSAIDPGRFAAEDQEQRRQAERTRWRVDPGEPVGLFVAMNYRLKGLAPLIRALAEIPREVRFRLAIIGDPKFSKYARLAARLGVAERCLFLGHRRDPKDAYFAGDFLVHPTFYDPCSLVVLEALACGLPVITTQYNGASELLSVPENGRVIQDPHNAQELAQAITDLLDPVAHPSHVAAARAAAQRWTFENHYQQMLQVFEEVVRRKKQGKESPG